MEIKHKYTEKVLFKSKKDSVKETVIEAVKKRRVLTMDDCGDYGTIKNETEKVLKFKYYFGYTSGQDEPDGAGSGTLKPDEKFHLPPEAVVTITGVDGGKE